MAKRSRFQAPSHVSSLEDVQRALREIQEALDAATMSRSKLSIETSDFALVAGNFHRVTTSGTLRARLPSASGDNLADPIYLSLEDVTGTVEIWAAPGQTVNGGATVSYTTNGIVELRSNGVGKWVGVAQLPAESPGGQALDAQYILGAANTSLPNGRVATDSTEIDVDLTTTGVASWVLRTASVALGKLANLTGLSVLGRASNSAGVMAAITATSSRQALLSNSAGDAIGWRSLELADLPTLPTPDWADVLAQDPSSGANNPSIASGQHLVFAVGGVSGGDIRSAGLLTFAATSDLYARAEGETEFDTGTNFLIRTNNTLRIAVTQSGELELSNDPGTLGQVLTSGGSGAPPTWATVDLSSVTYTAGDGIDLAGNVFSVDVSDFAGAGLEDDGSNNLRTSAVTGAISRAAGATASKFAGIRDNGSLETARTFLNFVSTSFDNAFSLTQDAGNDEIEVRIATFGSFYAEDGIGAIQTKFISFDSGDGTIVNVDDNTGGSGYINVSYDVDRTDSFAWTGNHSWVSSSFIVASTDDVSISAADNIVLQCSGEIRFAALEQVLITGSPSGAGVLRIGSGAEQDGFLIMQAAAGSTPTVGNDQGMFWVHEDGVPMFTQDNEDRELVQFQQTQKLLSSFGSGAVHQGVPFVLTKEIANQGTTSAGDAAIYSNGTAPFDFRVLFAAYFPTNSVAGSSLVLRDTAGGGGATLGASMSGVTAGVYQSWLGGATDVDPVISTGGQLFARASNRTMTGILWLLCMRV